KVKDKDGNLLVVYHGTDADFTEFDNKADGYYFTTDKNHEFVKNTKNTKKAYLNLKNPYYAKRRYEIESAIYSKGWRQNENGDWYDSIEYEGDRTLAKQLKEQGYDGIIYNGGLDEDYEGNNPPQYVAFNPEQIQRIDNQNTTP